MKASSVPYGEVTGGRMTARAVIRDAAFDPDNKPNLVFFESDVVPRASDHAASRSQGSSDTLEDNQAQDVRCLALFVEGGTRESLLGGLMLVESLGQDMYYRRMGSFVADSSMFSHASTETVIII